MPRGSSWFQQFLTDDDISCPANKTESCPPIFVSKMHVINDTKGKITEAQFATMVEAMNIQLTTFCNDWSVKPVTVVYSGLTAPINEKFLIYVTTNTEYTYPESYGYHLPPNDNGVMKIYICANVILELNTNGILFPSASGGSSVSSVLSHEILETIIDPTASKLYMANVNIEGNMLDVNILAEVCDPVNQLSYTVITSDHTKVQVSDYVLPSWYTQNGMAPYNYNNTLKKPFEVSENGYYSVTDIGIYIISFEGS